jgi:hypothetical protein
MPRIRATRIVLAAGLGCLLATGCSDGMKTAPVKGTLTYKGKPVPNGTITFIPEGNGPAATGEIRPDGTFELTTYKKGDGAVLGKHTVMIVAIQDQSDRLPEDRSPLPPPIVPAKYLSNQTSGLKAEVRDQSNTVDFDLTDDKAGPKK